jgi:hypothetical protein
MSRKKVSEIEFHITEREVDDCIVRMADLIKEGYTINNIKCDSRTFYDSFTITEPSIHIKLRRKFENE